MTFLEAIVKAQDKNNWFTCFPYKTKPHYEKIFSFDINGTLINAKGEKAELSKEDLLSIYWTVLPINKRL